MEDKVVTEEHLNDQVDGSEFFLLVMSGQVKLSIPLFVIVDENDIIENSNDEIHCSDLFGSSQPVWEFNHESDGVETLPE